MTADTRTICAVRRARPVVHLLAGLPGSGKTTYARELEASGVARVSVDEQMLARYGQIGIDYRVEDHGDLLAPVVTWARERVVGTVSTGASVVLDHGLGTCKDRDAFKLLALRNGADWELAHFRVAISVLLDRLDERARHAPSASMHITPEMLRYLASVYEEPNGEGERLIDTEATGLER